MLHNPTLARQSDIAHRVAQLNKRYENCTAEGVLEFALNSPLVGKLALVSSFGAESAVLLHLAAEIDPHLPVLFIDTNMLFQETLDYQLTLARHLGLRDVRVIRAENSDLRRADPGNDLHRINPDACCDLRKAAPLNLALEGFDAWITGRKRYQGGPRTTVPKFELDDDSRIKINPLAKWGAQELADYFDKFELPRHPLLARGFASIGCASCTTAVAPGETARAGRWRGADKQECGIHFGGGKPARTTQNEAAA